MSTLGVACVLSKSTFESPELAAKALKKEKDEEKEKEKQKAKAKELATKAKENGTPTKSTPTKVGLMSCLWNSRLSSVVVKAFSWLAPATKAITSQHKLAVHNPSQQSLS